MSNTFIPNFYPVFTEQNKDCFLNHPAIAPTVVEIDSVSFLTKPLQIGKTVDLIGISLNAELLNKGVVDHTDVIHPEIRLKSYWIQVEGQEKIVRVELGGINYATRALEGNSRNLEMHYINPELNIPTDMLLDKVSKESNPLGETIAIRVGLSGLLNVETGAICLHQTECVCIRIPLVCAVVGYDLEYSLDNLNRRPR